MAKTLQFRRDTTANLASVTGAEGEIFIDLTKDTVIVMDGSTAGGKPLATESYVTTAVSNIVASAPSTLDTLNELATALGNDANFSTSISNMIGVSGGYANSAFTKANTATVNAASASSYANSAFDKANTANTLAQAAYDTANNSVDTWVRSAANSASSYANSAYSQANTATVNASSASSYANGAFLAANSASAGACTAQSMATTASSYANSAYTQANTGTILAQAAFNTANSAGGGGGLTITDEASASSTYYPILGTITTGTLSAANTSSTKLTYVPSTGTLTAVDLNTTSDIQYKENVTPITDAINILNNIEGVSFNWKENGKKSYGVIAQELEKVLPELVSQGERGLSVSYLPLIALLIQAVKEQQQQINNLKQ